MQVFEKSNIAGCVLKNRIIRSATFEGMADGQGFPGTRYLSLYEMLSRNEIGAIITGFTYFSSEGKAMHPNQAGIDDESKIPFYEKVTSLVHENGSRIFMQIAHTGRQTIKSITQSVPLGVTAEKSNYFREIPRLIKTAEAYHLAGLFGRAALLAQKSGFDGIQIHAAHGYLVHQFISPNINNRNDEFGIEPEIGIGSFFLEKVIDSIRELCGKSFPVLVKISCGEDIGDKYTESHFINLVRFLDKKNIDAIEISYGTMDHALNIFRGSLPLSMVLDYNPLFKTNSPVKRCLLKALVAPHLMKKNMDFTPMYNLKYSSLAKMHTGKKIICVGGFRSYQEINYAITNEQADFISMCRPFLREPDLVIRMQSDSGYVSKCKNCNKCAIMCDSPFPTRCYEHNNF
jgi:2,4-dienoyl-CoA reductase-like NADH-dependent reductase (Old Yellow Enzyme family)